MPLKNDYAEPIVARNNVLSLLLKVFVGLRTSPFDEVINFGLFFIGFIIVLGGVGGAELESSIWPGLVLSSIGLVIAGYRPLLVKYISRKAYR